ncbi:7287_t:CDS:1, partial [Racocetra fulgida]
NGQFKETLVQMFKNILREVKEEKEKATYCYTGNEKEHHAQVSKEKTEQLT